MDLGEDGSVARIMPADQWNNITTEDINKGIVIVDDAITYTEDVPDFNEFVWVPIPDMSKFKRIEWYNDYTEEVLLTNKAEENSFWEDNTTVEYINMLDSVEYYKGFYIGRYEASFENGLGQSKRYVRPEYGNSITNKNNMHLVYGIEWDSTLNWLIGNAIISSAEAGKTKIMDRDDIEFDSSSWGNYWGSTGDAIIDSGDINVTGESEYWKANNIYDLAGNLPEETQEKYSTEGYGNCRGGSYFGDYNTVAQRCVFHLEDAFMMLGVGSRISFYITLDSGSDA